MYETRNETNRPSVTSGEETDPSDLTFRLLSGESNQGCRRRPRTMYEIGRTLAELTGVTKRRTPDFYSLQVS